MNNKKKVISLSLDLNVLEKIDKERDGIPRSTYVNKILKEGKYGTIRKEKQG